MRVSYYVYLLYIQAVVSLNNKRYTDCLELLIPGSKFYKLVSKKLPHVHINIKDMFILIFAGKIYSALMPF